MHPHLFKSEVEFKLPGLGRSRGLMLGAGDGQLGGDAKGRDCWGKSHGMIQGIIMGYGKVGHCVARVLLPLGNRETGPVVTGLVCENIFLVSRRHVQHSAFQWPSFPQ